jgi:hypothetical protein
VFTNIVITIVYKIVLSSQTTCKNVFLDFIVTSVFIGKQFSVYSLQIVQDYLNYLKSRDSCSKPPKLTTLRVEVSLFVLSPEIETETKLRLTTG